MRGVIVSRNPLTIYVQGQRLTLLPEGGIWWESRATLLVADLHLGKDATFQQAAIPVPAMASGETIDRLYNLVEALSPQKVIVLGDLIHARTSLTPALKEQWLSRWSAHRSIEWILIEGNHDRASRKQIESLPIQVQRPAVYCEPFWLLHDASTEHPSLRENAPAYALAGHVHPTLKMPDNGQRIDCFHQTANCLTLPAFGRFTGRKSIAMEKGDAVYLIERRGKSHSIQAFGAKTWLQEAAEQAT